MKRSINQVDKSQSLSQYSKLRNLLAPFGTVVSFALLVDQVLTGTIFLQIAALLLFSIAATVCVIQFRKRIEQYALEKAEQIEMLYLQMKYAPNGKNHIIAIRGSAIFFAMIYFLTLIGFWKMLGQVFASVKNSLIDVWNMALGSGESSNINHSLSVLMLLAFGIFMWQLVLSCFVSKQDKPSILLEAYINNSHEYKWLAFLAWLSGQNWDSLRKYELLTTFYPIAYSPEVERQIQLREMERFHLFRNQLLSDAMDCGFGIFNQGKVELEIYPKKLIKFFIKNKDLLDLLLERFISLEVLRLENGERYKEHSYQIIDKIVFSIVQYPARIPAHVDDSKLSTEPEF